MKLKDILNEGRKSKDGVGVRFAEAVYSNVYAIEDLIVNEKKDPNEVIPTMGPVLLNAINACLKHNYKPNPKPAFTLKRDLESWGDISNQERINIFKKSLMELKKVVESLIKRPSKAGVKKLIIAHRDWWNYNYGANIALNGEGAHHNTIIESVNEGKHDAMLDKLADIVKGAKSFMDIGKELKKNGIKYSFGTDMIPMYTIDKPAKIAILNNKYVDGAERVVGTTAIGLMEGMVAEVTYDLGMARKGNGLTIYNKAEEEKGDYKNIAHVDNKGKIKFYDKKLPSKIKKQIEDEAKKMIESMNENKSTKLKSLLNESFGIGELPSSKLIKMKVSFSEIMNEGRASAKKLLQSVVKGETSRVEGIKMSKEMAQSFLDWQRLSPYGKKYGDLPFHMLFKAAFNWGLHRYADKKSKEYKELEAKAKTMKK